MRAVLWVCGVLAVTGPAFASGLPHIRAVVLTVQEDGTYAATISGLHFGEAPADVPCTACAPQEMEVATLGTNALVPVNVTSWTNTTVTLTGIAASASEALRFTVWNAAAANAAAASRATEPVKTLPHITSVVASGSGANLTVTVTGSGFGSAPPQVGQTTTSPYVQFTDYNAAVPASGSGAGYPWNGGFCGENQCDGVTIGYAFWSDTQIVLTGFAGYYGTGPYISSSGDAFCVAVWPSSSQSDGTSGGNAKCGRLP